MRNTKCWEPILTVRAPLPCTKAKAGQTAQLTRECVRLALEGWLPGALAADAKDPFSLDNVTKYFEKGMRQSFLIRKEKLLMNAFLNCEAEKLVDWKHHPDLVKIISKCRNCSFLQ